MKIRKRNSILMFIVKKVISSIFWIIGVVGIVQIVDFGRESGNDYYNEATKKHINQLIKEDGTYNNLDIEVINIDHDFKFLTIYYPLIEYNDNRLNTFPWVGYIICCIFFTALFICLFPVIIEIITNCDINSNINSNKVYSSIYNTGALLFLLCIFLFAIVSTFYKNINIENIENIIENVLQNEDIVMTIKYNGLPNLENNIQDVRLSNNQYFKKIMKNNYELDTKLGNNYKIIHNKALNCELNNLKMVKNGTIKDDILENMTSIKNNNIEISINKINKSYYSKIIVNNKELYLNDLYIESKGDSLYLSNLNNGKSGIYFKCKDSKYKLYFNDLLLKENKKEYNIDNLIQYISYDF